ncbi:hypothetical protein AB0M92_31740 [Streptomyces sp. NPDC051582]|uniref:hypothetical protein n=1 Tax=Streptomyces sp. NPDC051582 TaxID=3155167 RepID=UPI0034285CFF
MRGEQEWGALPPPAEVARHAAGAFARHPRELAGTLAAALDRGVPAEAPPAGRYLGSTRRSHAAR